MPPKNSKDSENKKKKTEAEVIDITPFLKNKKPAAEDVIADSVQSLDSLLTLTELSTDDIAGTLIARLVYEVDLLPEISSTILLDEMKMRIKAHEDLVDQLEGYVE